MRTGLPPKKQSFRNDAISFSRRSNSASGAGRGANKLTELPIYQLLKAFKLNQYARRLDEMGYGHNIEKLSRLKVSKRNQIISEMNVMPGHKAKL